MSSSFKAAEGIMVTDTTAAAAEVSFALAEAACWWSCERGTKAQEGALSSRVAPLHTKEESASFRMVTDATSSSLAAPRLHSPE